MRTYSHISMHEQTLICCRSRIMQQGYTPQGIEISASTLNMNLSASFTGSIDIHSNAEPEWPHGTVAGSALCAYRYIWIEIYSCIASFIKIPFRGTFRNPLLSLPGTFRDSVFLPSLYNLPVISKESEQEHLLPGPSWFLPFWLPELTFLLFPSGFPSGFLPGTACNQRRTNNSVWSQARKKKRERA